MALCYAFRNLNAISSRLLLSAQPVIFRRGFKDRKRWYKEVRVTATNGNNSEFEVNLDQRKLRTPNGKVLRIPNELLAHAVAEEWAAQPELIRPSQMHLTSLSQKAMDNPSEESAEDIATHILRFVPTDTVLCRVEEPQELFREMEAEWSPVVAWFNERFGTDLAPTSGLAGAAMSDADHKLLSRHIKSYGHWALRGLSEGTEALKSFFLMAASVDGFLSVEEAVRCSLLEVDFQTKHWGAVEWAHGLEREALLARSSAALLFVRLCSSGVGTHTRLRVVDKNGA